MIAKERNVPYEFVLVSFETGEHKQQAHLEHQPFGQVPYIAVRRVSSSSYCNDHLCGFSYVPTLARVARRWL